MLIDKYTNILGASIHCHSPLHSYGIYSIHYSSYLDCIHSENLFHFSISIYLKHNIRHLFLLTITFCIFLWIFVYFLTSFIRPLKLSGLNVDTCAYYMSCHIEESYGKQIELELEFFGKFVGEWRLPSHHVWSTVEKVQGQLLRLHQRSRPPVSVQHHIRSVHDGQRHLIAHWSHRLAGPSFSSHEHSGL